MRGLRKRNTPLLRRSTRVSKATEEDEEVKPLEEMETQVITYNDDGEESDGIDTDDLSSAGSDSEPESEEETKRRSKRVLKRVEDCEDVSDNNENLEVLEAVGLSPGSRRNTRSRTTSEGGKSAKPVTNGNMKVKSENSSQVVHKTRGRPRKYPENVQKDIMDKERESLDSQEERNSTKTPESPVVQQADGSNKNTVHKTRGRPRKSPGNVQKDRVDDKERESLDSQEERNSTKTPESPVVQEADGSNKNTVHKTRGRPRKSPGNVQKDRVDDKEREPLDSQEERNSTKTPKSPVVQQADGSNEITPKSTDSQVDESHKNAHNSLEHSEVCADKSLSSENGHHQQTSPCNLNITKQPEVSKKDIETPVSTSEIVADTSGLIQEESKSTSLIQPNEIPNPGNEKIKDVSTESETPVGKLRSSVADEEGRSLARKYPTYLRDTEEYALNYITQEIHHPVITCFRELNKSDIYTLVGGNKMKKACSNFELSIIYLGLIDLIAAVNNNPLYGENLNAKFSKNISSTVQKILLEFKNILGTWALSGNGQLSSRYSLILSYLRRIVPMFEKAEFDKEFNDILDCIEKEVTRCRMNQEKLKAMGSSTSENSSDKKSSLEPVDGESRSILNEIVLNVNLNVKLDESDDEEVTLVGEEKTSKIFGKPLKASPKLTGSAMKRTKKQRSTPDSRDKNISKNTTPATAKKQNIETPKTPTTVNATTTKPKILAPFFQSNSPKTSSGKPSMSKGNGTSNALSAKRCANEELVSDNDKKKRKLEEITSPVTSKERGSIRNFFNTLAIPTAAENITTDATESVPVPTSSPSVIKPAVNAFALMMNRSRELAQKKKLGKLGTTGIPTLKLDAVKT